MPQSPAISVIVPVYNVKQWLERAISSITRQTFDNIEVILVDDGSTDGSSLLCDEMKKGDQRIKVIHQQNTGAAGARNAALEQACGTYIYFMDADDWCEPSMLEDLYQMAEANSLDLVITGYYIDTYYSASQYYREDRIAPKIVFRSQDEFRNQSSALFDSQLLYAPWNKLYRRSYLLEKEIVFPETFWDDLPFNLDVIRDIEKVGCLDGQYYHFLRARQESENAKYRADMFDKREEEHFWIVELYRYWRLDDVGVQEFISRRYSERLIGCIENVTNKNCTLSKREKKEIISKMIKTDHAVDAFSKARPRSFMMRVMLVPLKMQNTTLTMAQSRLISWVKRKNTKLFAWLKANR